MSDEQKNAIVIQFEEADSTIFSHNYIGNVNPLQVIAVCEYLIMENKQLLLEFMTNQKMAQQQIIRPQ